MKKIETVQTRLVFPCDLNDQNNLFGGTAMKWMDEVAYITAKRFSKKEMVTINTDKIKFIKPIKQGDILNIIGTIEKSGNVKLQVLVEINIEDISNDKFEKAIEGRFTFAAISNGKLIRLS